MTQSEGLRQNPSKEFVSLFFLNIEMPQVAVFRLLSNGTLDASFGTGGLYKFSNDAWNKPSLTNVEAGGGPVSTGQAAELGPLTA